MGSDIVAVNEIITPSKYGKMVPKTKVKPKEREPFSEKAYCDIY